MQKFNRVSKILLIKNGRVLLLFSKKLKKYHLPGGHLEDNETFLSAIKREVREETTINLTTDPIVVYSKPNFNLFRKIFKYNEPLFISLSPEHENYVWANIREAHRYPLCEFTKKDIFHLQKHWINFRKRQKIIDYFDE